jgi:tRNA A37 threonylcarbamoyladenosine biosynthesis protein TsaE
MEDLGALLSQIATRPGDVLLLDGDLGAGKTCLSRGFVQTLLGGAAANDGSEQQRVTSPTYLLCNSYDIASERLNDYDDANDQRYSDNASPKT